MPECHHSGIFLNTYYSGLSSLSIKSLISLTLVVINDSVNYALSALPWLLASTLVFQRLSSPPPYHL